MSTTYTFVIDVDGTICELKTVGESYSNLRPKLDMISKINDMFDAGHTIILFSARGMRTYGGDMYYIEKEVRPIMEAWLNKYNVKYHNLVLGKPWGANVRYVDDNAMHISEFLEMKI